MSFLFLIAETRDPTEFNLAGYKMHISVISNQCECGTSREHLASREQDLLREARGQGNVVNER